MKVRERNEAKRARFREAEEKNEHEIHTSNE